MSTQYFGILLKYCSLPCNVYIVVNEDKTSTKKASIKKLKPKDLARIISQPDVSLGELYKLQNNFLENEQSSKNNVHFSTLSFSKNQRKSNLEVLDSFEDLPVCFLTDNMTVNTSSVSLLYEIRENYHEFSPLSMLEEYDLATQSELESLDELRYNNIRNSYSIYIFIQFIY